jgi:hypothetical protein
VPVWLEAADEAHAADDKNMLDVQKAESGLIMIMYSRSSTHTQDSFIRIQAGGAD